MLRFSGQKNRGHRLGCGSWQEEPTGGDEGSIGATLTVHVWRSVSRGLYVYLLLVEKQIHMWFNCLKITQNFFLIMMIIIIVMQLYCHPLFVLPSCILTLQKAHLEGFKCDDIISWQCSNDLNIVLVQSG